MDSALWEFGSELRGTEGERERKPLGGVVSAFDHQEGQAMINSVEAEIGHQGILKLMLKTVFNVYLQMPVVMKAKCFHHLSALSSPHP